MAEPWSDTNVLTAADLAGLPWGVMGYALGSTSDQTGITAEVDITSLTVTFTAVSTRLYRTTMTIVGLQNTSAALWNLLIADGANVRKKNSYMNLGIGERGTITIVLLETGLSGSITRKGRTSTSAGTLTVEGTSDRTPTIIVEDLGPG